MKKMGILVGAIVLIMVMMASVTFADGTYYTYDDLNATQISSCLYDVSYSISYIRGIANDGTPYWSVTDRYSEIKLVLIVYDEDTNNATEFESLAIGASFTMSPSPSMYQINRWNRNKRYGKAYLDEDNDPVIEFNLDLKGGVTKKTVVQWIERSIRITRNFAEYIGFR